MGSLTLRASHLRERLRPAPRGIRAGRAPQRRTATGRVSSSAGRRRLVSPAGATPGPCSAAAGVVDPVDLDLLLAQALVHLGVLGDGLLVQADALDRHGLLLHDRALGMQRDLVLFLADRGAVEGTVDVGVGDGLALDPDLLAGDRHGLGHVLGDDVLPQTSAADLLRAGAHVEALLGPGHGVIGRGARGVVAHRPVADVVVHAVPVAVPARARVGQAGRPPGVGDIAVPVAAVPVAVAGTGAQFVVAVELRLLLRREVAVGVDPRGVLHPVLADGYADPVVGEVGVADG